MFSPDQYELLDFGGGRRLERFGEVTLDRPCPAAADMPSADPAAWRRADARFDETDAEQGTWTFHRTLPERWTIAHGPLVLEVKPTALGQVGVFPEQAENWDWIAEQVCEAASGPLRLLNLFAYTGGSTLAAVAAGAEVAHVDAARTMVAWARRNAESSGLTGAPIRWIVEDAVKFVKREIRRRNRYDAVILDPPSYGHGPRGEVWRLAKQLGRLLELCGQLTLPRRRFLLLTCHTPGFSPERLRELVAEALGGAGRLTARPLVLRTAAGRELSAGVVVRWEEAG
jgi:23S rRNA (cytosine1962-C5)-methyltransferase